ncbi:Mad3/BUB1 homology region 1-domain-containing protein [Gamsiella multidivaricata]|uniref:Mad3/BUB1 homology region 1-domain-containing protein n=1 Tax=Gamsiella multidivaricata TaxID=101098 RepID=UPI00221ED6B5|nr:Mad3/BUB1 homology region 1-domain-containing protein [Gamsiella multidivaricata]KAG0366413.1 hypothetical protein BGZ54_005372 [Gamsiella multidivaricata]KAI7822369.1 Mad3/BUB1 homology region 1-domain-containing protein [Gamsiella multidivaricata]
MHQQQRQHHESHDQEGSIATSTTTSPSHPSSGYAQVVDFDDIELEKENIQPIRQGRSAQVLSRLFTTQPEDRAHELALQRQRFQVELQEFDEMDDPMDVFMRYVKWTIENYPQSAAQGHDSRLTPLLEQAISSFQDKERYRNDLRFVKLFILYSEKVELPLDVFRFMETNSIGSELSVFYEAYAEYLESRDEFDKAKDILSLGIHRRAQPSKRLQRQLEDFQQREQRRQEELERETLESLSSAQPLRSADIPATTTIHRRVLGAKLSSTESLPANATAQGHVPVGYGRPPSTSSRTSTTSTQQRPNARLSVFADSNAASRPTGRPTGPSQRSCVSQENTTWRDLGVEQVRRKENVQEVTGWKGTRLTAEDSFARRPHPKLEVYRDPDNEGENSTNAPQNSRPSSTDMHETTVSLQQPAQRTQSEQPVQYEQSAQPAQPEKPVQPAQLPRLTQSSQLVKPAQPVQSVAVPGPSIQQQQQQFPITISERGQRERRMIRLDQIYDGGQEFTIEEIRARQTRYQIKNAENLNSRSQPAAYIEHSGREYRNQEEPERGGDETAETQLKQMSHNTCAALNQQRPAAPIKPLLPASPSEEERRVFESRRRMTPSSPTIHTKYASAEMNKIFSDRSRSQRSIDSEWSTEGSQSEYEGDFVNSVKSFPILDIPLEMPASTRAYLEDDVYDESEEDDDDGRKGQTDIFLKKLERGYESTITRDIEALKRKRAEEMGADITAQLGRGGNRLSLRANKRTSSRFDPNGTQDYSNITMVIRHRSQQMQQLPHQNQQAHHDLDRLDSTNKGHTPGGYQAKSISSVGRLSSGSTSGIRSSSGITIAQGQKSRHMIHAGGPAVSSRDRPRAFEVFRDEATTLDVDSVPMLEDEAPPPYLDHEEPL